MRKATRKTTVNMPGDVVIQGETPGGGQRGLIPISRLFAYGEFQRDARFHQIKRFKALDWDALGELVVCEAWKWIDPVMVGLFHVAEGRTRMTWLKVLFPDGVYTEEHAALGLIPKGYSVGDTVMIACTIYDRHPLDLFFMFNDKDRVKGYQNFALKLKDPNHYKAETELAKIFEDKFRIRIVHANGRCAARKDPNTTVSAHAMIKYFVNKNTGEVTDSGRKLVIDTLSVITEVYRRPAGRKNALIEYAALTYQFMWAIADVVKDSGYELSLIKEALRWAYEEHDERAEFILNNPDCKGGGGNGGKDKMVKYIIDLIKKYLEKGQ